MFRHARFILASVLLCSAVFMHAEEGLCAKVPAGAVVGFALPDKQYQLVRAGTVRSIALYEQLEAGDKVLMTSAGAQLSVSDSRGVAITYRASQAPLCIISGPTVTWINNVIRIMGSKLTRQGEQDWHPLSVRALSQPPAFDMESLSDGSAVVGAGSRNLAFSWHDGIQPYHLILTNPAGDVVVDAADLPTHFLTLSKPLLLTRGRYSIRVEDNTQQSVSGSFEVSDAVFHGKVSTKATPADQIQSIAEVARIIDQADNRKFDAFCWISPGNSLFMLRSLMEALSQGDKLDTTP